MTGFINTSGNYLINAGNVSSSGNVIAPYFIGDGSQLTGVTTSGNAIASGSSNVAIPTGGGNVAVSVGGTSNVAVFTTTGEKITGTISSTGDISTAGFFIGDGSQLTGITASGAIISNGTSNVKVVSSGGNVTVGISGTGNVAVFAATGVTVSGIISSTGNVLAGNLTTGGAVSATSNVTGNYILGNGYYLSGLSTITYGNANVAAYLPVYTGNVGAGNVLATSLVSATGNVAGNYILGNGYYLTGLGGVTYGNANVAAYLPVYTGNVGAGNVLVTGVVSATGNVTGNYILGNGALLTGITSSGTSISNGTSNVNVSASNGNVTVGIAGTANVAVFASTGIVVTGIASATANVQAGNLLTNGIVSAAGNITSGANINVSSGIYTNLVSAGASITGGNLITGGTVSATGNIASAANVSGVTLKGNVEGTTISTSGNITGGNINTGGAISATGNITSGNLSTTLVSSTTLSATGNVQGGNIRTAGLISATGNITGGNLTVTSITGTLSTAAQTNITSLGTLTSLNSGAISSSGNITGANILTGGLISATGTITGANITGANILTGGLISATGNITGGNILGGANVNATTHTGTTVSVTGNVAGGNILTGGLISSTGNITGGNLTVSTGSVTLGSVVNANANGVGNIGSSTKYFNTVFALATSAQYADLAENYTADANYEPGTVLEFGGSCEVTVAKETGTTRVAGVVSTNPSYLMNAGLSGEFVVAVALQGRVPTKVQGIVRKGDLLVATLGGCASVDNNARAGSIVGKALEDFDGDTGIIEVVVGRC